MSTSTPTLARFAFAAALLSTLAVGRADDTPTQDVRIDVPAKANAIGGEYLLPANPRDDRRRSIRLGRTPVFATPVPRGKGTGLMLRNRLHAPVTVEVELRAIDNARIGAELPQRITLAPLESKEIVLVHGIDVLRQGSADFRYHASVGDPKRRPDRSHIYAWPLAQKQRSRISQTYLGPTHDEPMSRYAIDIAAPEGTPVVAARAGVVVFLEDRFFESGIDRDEFKQKANHVRILHDDGSMATYAHLAPESVNLVPGQRVAVGDEIGLSGNTGYSSGPHLHFAVLVNDNMEVVAIPFRMDGVELPAVADE